MVTVFVHFVFSSSCLAPQITPSYQASSCRPMIPRGAALDRAMYLTETLDLMNEMCPSQLDVIRRLALILLDAHEEKPVEKMRLVKSDVMH